MRLGGSGNLRLEIIDADLGILETRQARVDRPTTIENLDRALLQFAVARLLPGLHVHQLIAQTPRSRRWQLSPAHLGSADACTLPRALCDRCGHAFSRAFRGEFLSLLKGSLKRRYLTSQQASIHQAQRPASTTVRDCRGPVVLSAAVQVVPRPRSGGDRAWEPTPQWR